MRFETIAAQAAHQADPATGAVAPPIYLSTTFERDADGEYPRGFVYSRSDNPNRRALEECLAILEGGEPNDAVATAFASGSAATAAVFQALSPGDHVIAPDDCYHGTARMLREILAPWGLRTTFVDMTDPETVRREIQPETRIIWTETPSNPLLKIADIAEMASIARSAGALCVCDNTWATPMLQRPLTLGADLVVHSTTKYISGHEDVTGGVVVSAQDDAFVQRIRLIQNVAGAVPSPFDCWLTLRGIRTLHVRMPVHSANAGRVARFLQDHPRVAAVHYPGLPGHPGHDIAARQMTDFGGMLSFQVVGGQNAAMRVAARVRLFVRATSLGGTQSLIEHRASIEGPDSKTPDDLLRVSVGLENADDLIDDLGQALE
ncbi:MAG: aminotransferase class I/II-fold pyridoxal phosphate-dependent enzyme [Dehalococcoidia bacterium]|nr:aminotransferase class I/II-fold pyridoxal phosphate-dependent enzyme [Dehalococcoidia bacterium]